MIWFLSRGCGGPPMTALAQEHEYPLVWRWRLMEEDRGRARPFQPFFTVYQSEREKNTEMGSDSSMRQSESCLSPSLERTPLSLSLSLSLFLSLERGRLKHQDRLNFPYSFNCWTLNCSEMASLSSVSLSPYEMALHSLNNSVCVGFEDVSSTPLFFSLSFFLFSFYTLLFDVVEWVSEGTAEMWRRVSTWRCRDGVVYFNII